jgi:hypothetical protein
MFVDPNYNHKLVSELFLLGCYDMYLVKYYGNLGQNNAA